MVKFRELYLDMSMIKGIKSHVYGIICVLIIWPRFLINDNSTVMKGSSPDLKNLKCHMKTDEKASSL